MSKTRRHERVPLVTDVTIQTGGRQPARFAAHVFSLSRGGLGIYSAYYLPPGALVKAELIVPVPGEGLRRVTLYGTTRWAKVQPDGDVLGVEIMVDHGGGDYDWFVEHFDLCARARRPVRPSRESVQPTGTTVTHH